jgi:hypothetical protein
VYGYSGGPKGWSFPALPRSVWLAVLIGFRLSSQNMPLPTGMAEDDPGNLDSGLLTDFGTPDVPSLNSYCGAVAVKGLCAANTVNPLCIVTSHCHGIAGWLRGGQHRGHSKIHAGLD